MSFANAKQQIHLRAVSTSRAEPALIRLAERDQFSPRLRDVLQALLDLCTCELELRVSETLTEFEKQLVRLADKATIHQQNEYFDSVRELKRCRTDVAARFMQSLENSLARLGEDITPSIGARGTKSTTLNLALTDSIQMDESVVLSDIATKVEMRVREPLFALGRRFGALTGSPLLAAEIMPLGPRSIVEALRYGAFVLDFALEHRLVLYRCFERVVMNQTGSLYVALNNCLIERGILPDLHTLSTTDGTAATFPRFAAKPSVNRFSQASAGVSDAKSVPISSAVHPIPVPIRSAARNDFFGTLRQLMGECRRAETYTATGDDLQAVLAALQACQPVASIAEGAPRLHSAEEIKQEALVLLREHSADGRMPRISEEDSDAIDATAMLFEFLSRRARLNGVASRILAKLQLPILRAAIKDKSFFSDRNHSARRLLNEFAEAALFWIDENETEKDVALIDTLQRLTDRVACEYQGGTAVFAAASEELSQHIEELVRRGEAAERNHIEAVAGREKFERARELAAAAIGERIARAGSNEFLRALLEYIWTDVLTFTLLRDGAEGTRYARQLEVVDQLLAATLEKGSESGVSLSPDVHAEIESGLMQVGLPDDDIRAVTKKLFARAEDDEQENPISQTELAIKLKLKARRDGSQKAAPKSIPPFDKAAVLDREERAAIDALYTLQVGTWFEFKINPEGDAVRCKLSWYSTDSGRCLFVNQRGVPSEKTMQELASEMAGGRARIISEERESLVDRAWTAIRDTLGSFSERMQSPPRATTVVEARGTNQTLHQLTMQNERPRQQEPRTLLLVDDEVGILRALTRLLRADGYRILCAGSAAEAMELLAQHEVQVIIADQRMPHVSGTQFLTKVMEMRPDTVRILLSGYSDAVSVMDAISRGAIYKFLTKPWDDEDIRLQVRDAFQACEVY